MEFPSTNATIALCDAGSGHELLHMRLKGSPMVLVRMPKPGKLLLRLGNAHPAKITASIDGTEVLSTDVLQPGRHEFAPPLLAFSTTGSCSEQEPAAKDNGDDSAGATAAFLASLGVEPDPTPVKFKAPYLGAPGGRVSVRIQYMREDNGDWFDDDFRRVDEVVYNVNGVEDFDRAVNENRHRIEFTRGTGQTEPSLCGLCEALRFVEPGHQHVEHDCGHSH